MKKRVGIITNDQILFNKIRLLLRDVAEVIMLDDKGQPHGFDLLFSDTRYTSPDFYTVKIGMDIPLPFRHEDVLSAFYAVKSSHGDTLTLSTTSCSPSNVHYSNTFPLRVHSTHNANSSFRHL